MKPNLDKRLIYLGVGVIFLIIIIGVAITMTQNSGASNEASSSELTTETVVSQEPPEMATNELEHEYIYERPNHQRRVVAIRELDASEYPVPFDFSDYGKERIKKGFFYALVILDIDTDVQLKTETITEVAELEIISTYQHPDIEQVYRQLEIRYENGHAVYKRDRQYFVTSLDEPRLFRKFTIYDSIMSIMPIIPSNNTSVIDVYRTPSKVVQFSITDQQFYTYPQDNAMPVPNSFSWEGKTILHNPASTTFQGASLSKITDEPRLKQLTIGDSSEVVFERLGRPISVDWLLGYYLKYEDLYIYSQMVEKGDTLLFDPVHSVLYTGDYPVAGLYTGMTFKEVEQVLGPQPALYFSEGDEMTYPLSTGFSKDGFSIKVGFDSDLKVSQFYIRVSEEEKGGVFVPQKNEIELAFSEENFDADGLEGITDFATGYDSCYFNASAVTSGGVVGIDIGFYTYDLSRRAPTLVSDQPMRMVFELLHDANPSVIAIGKEDGILYKIDMNTFAQTPMSGPNYKDYVVRGGIVTKAALFSDEMFLENYGFSTAETVGQFDVSVPKDWSSRYGDYPEGLYWSMANVFSSDIGLDLSALKGKTVAATVYRLSEGLKGRDRVSDFRYPSNVVILRDDDQIKGAWLMFNTGSIGPSLGMNDFETITGKAFENWVWDEGILVLTTSYLPSPEATIQNFFSAIQSGDKQNANACLTPSSLLSSLTSNLNRSERLYHEGFNADNSLVENIISATDVEIISYYGNQSLKPIENDQAYFDAMPLGTRIGVEISLKLKWRENQFNVEGKDTRFGVLQKTPYGWKFDGLGTGR